MIRFASINDVDALLAIENASFKDGLYDKKQMLYELNENPFAKTLVFIQDDKIIGFIIYMITFNSSTIVQVAVDPSYRNRGIASKLIEGTIDEIKKLGYGEVENITLEVRKNNEAAHNLYLKNGFKDVVVKPHYYDNGDDAIYMMRVLL